ncbi:hypothetical protein HDU97_009390 [Phlyctochytrium planicorne]|nr:hypothetical protein HDU97_009390 [Phlyctochytrium planicorne]
MKHGVKVFQKKLNRSPEHRLALLRNLASSLIIHGKIETTLPKAKFVKNMAEQLVDWAKKGGPRYEKKIQRRFYSSGVDACGSGIVEVLNGKLVMVEIGILQTGVAYPKLQLLAARFKGRNGGYTRIIKNNLRFGGDKAPLAIIEYVNNPKDTIKLLADQHLEKIEADLKAVESRKYDVTKVTLVDPVTRVEVEAVADFKMRADVSSTDVKQLGRKELFLRKLANKLRKSVLTAPIARANEAAGFEKLKRKSNSKDDARLQRLQAAIDALPADQRAGFVENYATRGPFSADPLLSHQRARRVGRTKTVAMDANGKVHWVVQFDEVEADTKAEPVLNVNEGGREERDAGTEKVKDAGTSGGGVLGKLMGAFKGKK